MLLVDAGEGIDQAGQELPLRSLGAQLHHLGAFDGFRAQHALRGIDRIAPEIAGEIARFRQAPDRLLDQRAAGENLHLG